MAAGPMTAGGCMRKKRAKHHQMDIPSTQNQLRKVVDFVEGLAQQAGFSEETIVDIAISVSEAVNNAILHGNKNDPRKKVHILAETSENVIVLKIRDEGQGFAPVTVCDPRDPDNLMKCTGRGILIQKTLMDEVNFRIAPGGGTEVELIKRLPAAKAKRKK
jgi:serine/threonine-protein kinase RsbW